MPILHSLPEQLAVMMCDPDIIPSHKHRTARISEIHPRPYTGPMPVVAANHRMNRLLNPTCGGSARVEAPLRQVVSKTSGAS